MHRAEGPSGGMQVPVVSRETLERLREFEALARKFNRRINLFAPADESQIWERHILDSLQLLVLAPESWRRWVDLGSGGGFPGLVMSVVACDLPGEREVILVECDSRKAEFLREAAARFAPRTVIRAERIEAVDPLCGDVVSARALAPLRELLGLVRRHLSAAGVALLPKGRRVETEFDAARARWSFLADRIASVTDAGATILRVRCIEAA